MPRISWKTTSPAGEEETLHTPGPHITPALDLGLSSSTPSLTTTCGLFDVLTPQPDPIDMIMNSDKDPSLTTALCKDIDMTKDAELGRTMRLESLDPQELDTLLGELSAPQPEEAEEAAVPQAPWDGEVDSPQQADHDYCEDWNVLSEFMEMTKPCLAQPAEETDATLAVLANEALQQTEFLETAQDLEPILLGSVRLGAPAEQPSEEAVLVPEEEPAAARDVKYWERRRKNNAASAASRRTRKEKRLALEEERRALQSRNEDLAADVARLEALTTEWKARLLTLIG